MIAALPLSESHSIIPTALVQATQEAYRAWRLEIKKTRSLPAYGLYKAVEYLFHLPLPPSHMHPVRRSRGTGTSKGPPGILLPTILPVHRTVTVNARSIQPPWPCLLTCWITRHLGVDEPLLAWSPLFSF